MPDAQDIHHCRQSKGRTGDWQSIEQTNMVNSIGIYFYGPDDVEIIHVDAMCQPFVVGNIVELEVVNNNKEQWNVTPIKIKVIIRNIERRISIAYSKSGNVIKHIDFFLSVEHIR